MKQKALSWLLALCLIVGLLPTAALAAENDVDTGTPVVSAVTALQERINALPDADTLAEMDEDEQAKVYVEVCAIYDAIDELTDEAAKALDVSALEEAAAFFTQQIMPLDESDNDTVMFGNCGAPDSESSVNWALTANDNDTTDPTYTLTISGEGAMADYKSNIRNSTATQPWRAGQTGIDVEKITKIVVKPGVTKIGAFAFNGITKVTEYDIAATVADIGKWGLETSSVEHFYLNENPNYTVDRDGVLLNADKTELIAYPGGAAPRDSYTIPDTVTTVASGAFVGCDAAKLVIPSTVTTLPSWSFNGGTIQEIVCNTETLPESVFPNIETLEKISFGDAIKTLPKQAMFGCPKLCDVTLPDGLTSIGEQAFKDCTALSGIEFPASLESIGTQAFIKCTALSGIDFPEGLKEIGDQAFFRCTALTALVFPNSLTTIGGSAFSGCTGLKYVVHGSGIDNIGGSAFSGCTSLKVIDIHRAVNIGEVWDNEDKNRPDRDPTLNHACESTLEHVFYYMRSETQAKSAKGNIEWGAGHAGGGNTTNTYYVLTAEDAVPDYSATTTTPLRTGYTFSGWKEVHVDNPENVYTKVYTDKDQWQKNSYKADEKTATITQTAGETRSSATLKAPEARVYDGQPKAAVVATTGTWTGGKNVTYAKKGESEYTDNAPVAAGTYTAKLTVGEGETAVTVSVEFEITKAQPTVSISADKTSLQGGGQVKLTVSGVPEGGTVTVTQTDDQGSKVKPLDLTGNGNISVNLSNTTAKYTFTVRYAGGDNYKASSDTCDVSVTRYTSGGGGTTTYAVAVDSAKNGSVSVSPKNASKGATVTITVKPNSGYELDDLTVTDKNGKTVKVTEGKNGKYTFTMPASKVTVEASFTKIKEEPKVSFGDVSTSAYYYDAVAWAVENGVTGGTSATTFSPNAACTRAQAVTFLWRAAGSPAPKSSVNPFADISASAYYYDAVLWAVERGITAGTSATTFSPDATCTRAQIVTFLYRAVGTTTSGTNPFVDVADNAYYAAAVKWAVAEGVTAGTSASTFSPDASCTRGQIVTFLYRAYV